MKTTKEKPIIFNAEMVRAILDDRKTMTRRVVKSEIPIDRTATPEEWNRGKADPRMPDFETWGYKRGMHLFKSKGGSIFAAPCPYGQAGDRLWVRETFALIEGVPHCPWPHMEHRMIPAGSCLVWKASFDRAHSHKWKPSIFMPRWASRITLEITEVRVEKIKDITRSDIRAEGLVYPKECGSDDIEYDYKQWYQDEWIRLWDSINKKNYPWESNPYVWVISFKRM